MNVVPYFIFKKLLQIIGIADCSVEEDFESTFAEFKYKSEELVGASELIPVPKSCFAFHMRSDQKDPDIEDFKPIPDQDIDHLSFYLTNIIGMEFVIPILNKWSSILSVGKNELVKGILNQKYKKPILIQPVTTPLDREYIEEHGRIKKRNITSRLNKQLGDYCLLSGSPSDAVTWYKSAIEECKVFSDWEWVGASLESYALCLLLTNRDSHEVQAEAFAKYHEAISCYERKKADILVVEALFKLARLYLDHSNHMNMSECLSRLYDCSLSFPVHERIKITSSIAVLYKDSKWFRKFAFYMRETVLLCHSSGLSSSDVSQNIVLEFSKVYNIHINDNTDTTKNKMNVKSRREKVYENGINWIKIQSYILHLLVELSKDNTDTVQSKKYLIYILREIVPYLPEPSEEENNAILSSIRSINWVQQFNKHTSFMNSIEESNPHEQFKNGLGIFVSSKPVIDQTVIVKVARGANDPLFLYRPNKKAKSDVDCYSWADNTSHFDITFCNPINENLVIENLQIKLMALELLPNDRNSYDIQWNPKLEVIDTPQPVSRISLPKQSAKFKIPVKIPRVIRLEENNSSKKSMILLIPCQMLYTAFNIHFRESLFDLETASLPFILTNSFKYVDTAPSLDIQDKYHSWVQNQENKKKINDLTLSQRLYAGEHVHTSIIIKNSGSCDVDYILLNITENGNPIDSNNPSKILITDIQSINSIIQNKLPIKQNEEVEIPIHFSSFEIDDIQLTINFDCKSNQSKFNIWRRFSINYGFNIDPCISITRINASVYHNSISNYHQVVGMIEEDSNNASDFDCKYVVFEYDVCNYTNISYDLFFENVEDPLKIYKVDSISNPRSHKRILLAVKSNLFKDIVNEYIKLKNYLTLFEMFNQKYKLSWRLDNIRQGWVPIQEQSFNLSSMKKVIESLLTKYSFSIIGDDGIKLEQINNIYQVSCNKVYELEIKIDYNEEEEDDSLNSKYVSVLSTSRKSDSSIGISWIGKSMSIEMTTNPFTKRVPFCVHFDGTYNVSVCLQIVNDDQEMQTVWSSNIIIKSIYM